MPQITRNVATRILHYQIYMRLLIDVVEKGKRRGQREDTSCGYRAKQTRSTFAHIVLQIGAEPSSRFRLDYRKLPVFADQGRGACHLQKSLLKRLAKRRIPLNYNRKMPLRVRFPPGNCLRINPIWITKYRIGDSECFTAFEQQRINKRKSGPHAGHPVLEQIIPDAFEVGTGNPRHAIVLSLITERERVDLIVPRRIDRQCASR